MVQIRTPTNLNLPINPADKRMALFRDPHWHVVPPWIIRLVTNVFMARALGLIWNVKSFWGRILPRNNSVSLKFMRSPRLFLWNLMPFVHRHVEFTVSAGKPKGGNWYSKFLLWFYTPSKFNIVPWENCWLEHDRRNGNFSGAMLNLE